ncbi:MAG: MBL fold metallo-hydrolase [Candidatus Bipolaricaulota bacterium]|nr:MBL fold metallo-hydrolase [Candidatus Bipolaricaulota bacterium]
MPQAVITIIYDNRTADEKLWAGWGFSALIEFQNKRILFDTGADKIVLEHNADTLGIDLATTDALFLSHEHCDHIGAISSALHSGLEVIYPASFSPGFKQRIEEAHASPRPIASPTELSPGINTTGEMGREIKEHSLIIACEQGPFLITGCAHPGIVNIARKATELTGRPLSLIIGGFHLGAKQDAEVRRIADGLKGLDIERVAPCHCTGEKAIGILEEEFGEGYLKTEAGSKIEC